MLRKWFSILSLIAVLTLVAPPLGVQVPAPQAQGPSPTPDVPQPAEPAGAEPSQVSVKYTFQKPTVEPVEEYDKVTVPGLHNYGAPGEPILPFETVRILLPYGTDVEDIDVIPGDKVALEGSYVVESGQELRPTDSGPDFEEAPPDPTIYSSAEPFPGQLYSQESVQRLMGYTILFLRLSPIQYVPKMGQIYYYENMEVRVTTSFYARTAVAQRNMLRSTPEGLARVVSIVDNPQTIDTYSAVSRGVKAPLASLVDPADPYDYVLITSDVLSSSFQSLVNWKVVKGLEARIFTTEDIYANYSGTDNPDQIRNFIIDAYTTWVSTDHPLQYVALGGDDEIIPVRYLYEPGSGGASDGGWMPSDMYYAGLDGNWDADGDGLYGEDASSGSEGEECDFLAEVYVGRMNVDTAAEATNIVSKTLSYEQNPSADYLNRALLIGNQLDAITWGGNGKDTVAELIPQYNVTALYQRDGTYSQSAVINEMNDGTHLVNFDGHGNWSCCPLYSSQVDALTNSEYFLFYNLGCYTAAFDQNVSGDSEAVAEHYIFNESGAFAYIGNTRYGWYSPGSTNGPGEILDRLFFDTVVNSDTHNVGKALQIAKEDCYNYYWAHRWSILTLTLLGDPETSIATEFLSPIADITSPAGGNTLKNSVDIVGIAREGEADGATFGHYKVEHGSGNAPTSWTQIGATSYTSVTNGILAAGWDTSLLSDGLYTIRLTVDDGFGRISEDRAVVTLDNVYITFPPEGDFLRGGETITITGTAQGTDFQNYVLEYGRGESPTNWTWIGSSTVPVTDGVLMLWNTSAIAEADHYTVKLTVNGTGHVSTDTVKLYIDPTLQAGWPQSVAYRVVAPSMAIGDIDGDGDLEVVAAEGKADAYDAKVYAWHYDGTLVNGWPQETYGGKLSSPALADIDRDGDLEIIVGSTDDRVYAWHHDGSVVAGWPQWTGDDVHSSPAVGDIDGDGIMEIVVGSFDDQVYVWHYDGTAMNGWPQTAGNSVYSSPALGDLDSDGDMEIVVGTHGGTVYAWHHDGAIVSGWPVTTPVVHMFSSPALGDIDGDGDIETVVGADQVYAWHHDGTTVSGWPQPAGGSVGSSPALGDMDGDGDLEIIVGFNQVYAWHGDGTTVTGWPVALEFVTDSSPVLGDLDGDADMEVVIGSDDYDDHVYAWHHDGSVVADWPRIVPRFEGSGGLFGRLSSPILEDVDQDGDIEVTIGAESKVMMWDLAGAYDEANIEWKMFHHDLWHTGFYTSCMPNLPPFVRDVGASPGYVAPGSAVTITAKVSDEDGVSSVTAEIESPDETVRGTIALYDDGAHNDGAAGDGVYGNTWTTLLTKLDYVVDITAIDGLSKSYTHDNVASFTTQDVAYVQHNTYTINYDSINQDGTANPGEYVHFSITLENIGVLSAYGVTATISTIDPHISYYDTGAASFGDITAGGTATSGSYDYYFGVENTCPHSHTVRFNLDIGDSNGNAWTDSFDVTIIDNVGPAISWADASPRYTVAGEPVAVTAYYVEDGSGVSSVQAVIESPDETPIVTVTLYDDGAHNDGEAGDGTYGNAWTTDVTQRDYYVNFVTEDGLGNVRAYDNLALFTTKAFTKITDILFVPDYGGNSTDWFQPYHTNALDALGYSYDIWDTVWRGAPDSATLNLYTDGVIIWAAPYWGYFGDSDVQQDIQAYLDAGGTLFITGQDIGYYAGSTSFYQNYLHASYVQDDTNLYALSGIAGDPIGDGLTLGISGGDGANNQYYPDEINPISPAVTVFTYDTGATAALEEPFKPSQPRPQQGREPGAGSASRPWEEPERQPRLETEAEGEASPAGVISSGTAGLRVDTGTYRVVYFAFGFEGINSAGDRATAMERVVAWLRGALPRPTQISPADGSAVPVGDVIFAWSSVIGATGYQIQIDTTTAFTSPALISDTVSTTSYTATLSLGTWYWRMRALPGGAWTTVWELRATAPVVQVSTGGDSDYYAALAMTAGGELVSIWRRNGELWTARSVDSGATWSVETQLAGCCRDQPAMLRMADDSLWLVYTRNNDVWYRTSSDDGLTWSSEVQLTAHAAGDSNPDLAQTADGCIWVVWESGRGSGSNIWYKTTSDSGISWTPDTELPVDPGWNTNPTMAQAPDGTLWLVWFRSYSLAYSTSTDGGSTWSPLDFLGSVYPIVGPSLRRTADGTGTLWLAYSLVYHQAGRWRSHLTYQTSTDSGATWSDPQQFTRFVGDNSDPAVAAIGDGQVGLVWHSDRTGVPKVWFGVPGLQADIDPPPHVSGVEHMPSPDPDSDDVITIRGWALDETELSSVEMLWGIDGVAQTNFVMADDGTHNDGDAGDDQYGVQIAPLSAGSSVTYTVRATDVDGNRYTYAEMQSFQVLEPFTKTADILFVPDYGGNSTDWFRPYFTNALDELDYNYDVWDTGLRGAPDGATLDLYTDGVVIWAAPDWGYFEDSDVQQDIQAYLDVGGRLFITGQDIGYYAGSTSFYQNYLHALYVQDDTDLYTLNGTAGDPIGDGLALGISGGDGANNQWSPSEIDPLAPALPVLTYDTTVVSTIAEPTRRQPSWPKGEGGEPRATPTPAPWDGSEKPPQEPAEPVWAASPEGIISSGTAALRVDTGTYKAVYFSFGFEAISTAESRRTAMHRVLRWLGPWPTLYAVPDQIFTHATGPTRTIDLWAYAYDEESSVDELTYVISGTPPSGAGVELGANRYVTVTPSSAWCGYTDITVRVTDPGGLWDEDTFRVAVTWSCQGPLPVPDRAAPQGESITLNLTPYEPQIGDGTGMVWYATGEDHCSASGEYSADDVLTFTPDPGFLGSDTVTLHMVYPWGSEARQELILTWERATPVAPAQRVVFTKEASDATPHLGETLTFTLSLNTVPTQTQELQLRVIDPNPAPNYLDIISDSITGGAAYSPTIDAVVWENTLFPVGTQPRVIAFRVRITGIPPSGVAAGYPVTNTAMLIDLAMTGSLPEATAEAGIRISPLGVFLPTVIKDRGG
jgi:hypothetical protein